ncbi:MAG: ubiquinol--cytochrome-c reductase subunit 6 [Vezdaea acicularis]|nr:MAG: ubiquinol--cytochrome-c reductase subunit 6 [Vezdaea acicularis]
MGVYEFFADLAGSLAPAEAQAEAPAKEEEDEGEESKDEEGEGKEGGEDGGEEKEEETEEPEEEEEEEPEDPKPKIEEECANSKQCLPAKHHFEECVERVQAAQSDENHKGPHEDCVEECKPPHLQAVESI